MADLTIRRCRALLGTFVEIAVPTGYEAAVEDAFAAIAHVHARMSFHSEQSDLAALRRAPAGSVVAVDADTHAVLEIAARLYDRSGGIFDVAVGARLVAMGYLPRPNAVDLRVQDGAGADIEILSDHRVRCLRPLLIDLGGIAKGYAVDKAVAVLRAAGITEAVVNAGGDLKTIGEQPVHLRNARGDIGGAMLLTDSALATSSNLHLRRRHRLRSVVPHLRGTTQCLPVNHAVHVLAPDCVMADAMTKIAMADSCLAAEMAHEMGGEIIQQTDLRRAA
jgi:thiamine biosynthesis lipoprotein